MSQIGRYEIQKVLGRGAMGVVYAALDPLIGRQVAIKTIRIGAVEDGVATAELTERLQREARAAGVLSHPGIVTIHDVGEQGTDAYIVMEFIEGRTVEQMLASVVLQPFSLLLPILKKTADALDYAHAKGIIHRDVKPSNIMICPDGTVKIADFGIAKLSASNALTQSGCAIGTPNYMSPEQAQGLAVDGRADQFSLAVVAYRMLSGKLPFEGPTLTAILKKILWEEPEYNVVGINPPVRQVFEKALAKNPEGRYRNCAEFVGRLEEAYLESSAEKLITDVPSAGNRPAAEKAVSGGQSSPAASAPRKKTALAAVAAVTGIVVILGILFFVTKEMTKPEAPYQKVAIDPASIMESNTADSSTAAAPASSPSEQEQEQEQEAPAVQVPPPNPPPAKASINPPEKAVAAKARPPEPEPLAAPLLEPVPSSGTLTWSGSLQKNAILIIADSATIGSVSGKFPGKPIEIEIEPKDITVRQRPNALNNWNQIILYSGNRKYSQITIHWKIVN